MLRHLRYGLQVDFGVLRLYQIPQIGQALDLPVHFGAGAVVASERVIHGRRLRFERLSAKKSRMRLTFPSKD